MFVLVENDSITKTLNTSRGITIGEKFVMTSPLTFADGVAAASYGSATAKALADVTEDGITTPGLKTKHKEIIKKQASGLLTPTDWHVIKATEVESYSVSAEQTTYRAAVRTASNDMEALIDACTTVDELAALYVYTDGSRPLGEWPEEV